MRYAVLMEALVKAAILAQLKVTLCRCAWHLFNDRYTGYLFHPGMLATAAF